MQKFLKKLLVMLVIFNLIIGNIAYVGKSIASEIIVEDAKENRNIEFDAYFLNDGERLKNLVSDVDNKDLKMGFSLGVRGEGYFKDIQVSILPVDDTSKLNFDFSGDIKDNYEENNTLEDSQNKTLNEVNSASDELITSENVVSENTLTDNKESALTEIQVLEDEFKEDTLDNSVSENHILDDKTVENHNVNKSSFFDIEEVESGEEEKQNSLPDEFIEFNASNRNFNSEEIVITDDENKLPETVESFDNSVISLRRMGSGSERNYNFPIEYKNSKYISEGMISNSCIVRLTGNYIDEEGKEKLVKEDVKLNLSWVDNRDFSISSTTQKYIDYGNGVIIQALVKVDNTYDGNTLPVKETVLDIDVPEFINTYPTSVNVSVNKLYATNGESSGETSFSEDNWVYDMDSKMIHISTQNNDVERNYIDDTSGGLREEDNDPKYYNASGVDEYVITYIYRDVAISEDEHKLKSNIEATMELFGGEDSRIISKSVEAEYDLKAQTGKIASVDTENLTESLSKAYFYANYQTIDTYDLSINSKYIFNISNKDLVENLYFEDMENYYIDESGENIENNDLKYKEIVINKANFDNILGKDGEIRIYDKNDSQNIIGCINGDSVVDTNGDVSVYVETDISKLKFEISKPINEGNLAIKTTKGLKTLSIPKERFVSLKTILTRTNFDVKYTLSDEIINISTANTITTLEDTQTKASISLDDDSLSTLTPNEDFDIRIELNNDDKLSDLYGDSEFIIEYPTYVENIEILNTSIVYGEGLDISYVKNEGRKIFVGISGIQKTLNSGILTNGTNIILTTKINVNKFTPSMSDLFRMTYTNNEATNYFNNAYTEVAVNYKAPSGVVAINSIKNYKDDVSVISSVNQGTMTDTIMNYQESRNATMEIMVMNNNNNNVRNLKILGRFPFKGMKDFIDGSDVRKYSYDEYYI